MPMSKLSTLNYLISSYYEGKKEIEILNLNNPDSSLHQLEFEPSSESINAILNFASQYDVLKSKKTGNIELNLN